MKVYKEFENLAIPFIRAFIKELLYRFVLSKMPYMTFTKLLCVEILHTDIPDYALSVPAVKY